MYQNIREVANAIDQESITGQYAIENLQEIRKRLRGLGCKAGSKIFQFHRNKEQNKDYAYHWGGRRECQFNIQFHNKTDGNYIEFGLAFSLEDMRGCDIVEELEPRICRFNEFTKGANGDFSNYYIAVTNHNNESVEIRDRDLLIPNEWVEVGNFIQFCNMYKEHANRAGVRHILSEFDSLLPLYEYTME